MENNSENGVANTNSHPAIPVALLAASVGRLSIGIDWLSLSVPNDASPLIRMEKTADLLLSERKPANFGHGYDGWEVAGGYGKLIKRPRRDGVHADVLLVLPGRALDWIRDTHILGGDLLTPTTDKDLCRHFIKDGWKGTRIDPSIDVDDPEVNPGLVFEYLEQCSYVGKAKSYRRIVNRERGVKHKQGHGETVYIGGRQSSRMLRIYDKAEEMRKVNLELGHLTRFEMETKYEAAQLVFRRIAYEGAEIIPGLFRGWIDFKDPNDTASRVERRASAPWWSRIVESQKPIKLGLTRGISSPESQLNWIKRQGAKTLFLAQEYGFKDEIRAAMKKRASAVDETDRQAWAAFMLQKEERDQKRNAGSTSTEGTCNE